MHVDVSLERWACIAPLCQAKKEEICLGSPSRFSIMIMCTRYRFSPVGAPVRCQNILLASTIHGAPWYLCLVCAPPSWGGELPTTTQREKKTLPQHLRFRAELRHNLATPTRQDASNTFEDSCSPLDRSSNTYVEGARQSSGIAHLSVIIYTYLNNDRKSTFILCKC